MQAVLWIVTELVQNPSPSPSPSRAEGTKHLPLPLRERVGVRGSGSPDVVRINRSRQALREN
jgi:hypothetical protein